MPRKSEIAKQAISKADTHILNVFAKEVQKEKDFGVFAVTMDKVKTMYNAGLISFDEMLTLSSWCIIGNYFYQLNKSLKTEKDTSTYEIDTSRLHIGMILKNYRQLCEVIGIIPKTGKGRALQEKMIQRYIEYEKIVNSSKIIILDIYDEPKQKSKYNSSKFINQIKVLILHELANCITPNESYNSSNKTVIYRTTLSELMMKLNIVNEYFFKKQANFFLYFIKNYPNLFDESADKTSKDSFYWNYTFFYMTTIRKIKGLIRSALRSLVRDDMIAQESYYVVITYDNAHKEIRRKATSEEQAYLKEIRKDIAIEMGFLNSEIACFYKGKEFKDKFKQRIKNDKQWYDVYYEICLSITYRNLYKHINEYTALPFEKTVLKLNNNELMSMREYCMHNISSDLKKQADTMAERKTISLAKGIQKNDENNFSDCSIEEIIDLLNLKDDEKVTIYNEQFKERMYALINTLIPYNTVLELSNYCNSDGHNQGLATSYIDLIED